MCVTKKQQPKTEMIWNKMSIKKESPLNLALMLFISKTFRGVSLTMSTFRVAKGTKWPNNWTLQKDYVDLEEMKILMGEAKKLQACSHKIWREVLTMLSLAHSRFDCPASTYIVTIDVCYQKTTKNWNDVK